MWFRVIRKISRTTALNVHLVEARALIKEGTKKALQNYKAIQPFTVTPPYIVTMAFLHTGLVDAVEILPMVTRVGPLTISFTTDNVLDSYRLIRSVIMIAASIS